MTDSESEIASQLLGGHQDDSDPGLESDTGPVASGSHHVSSSNNWAGKNQYENSREFRFLYRHRTLLRKCFSKHVLGIQGFMQLY